MTDKERAEIRQLIEKRLEELETSLAEENEEAKPVEPDVAIGRLSRLDSMQGQQMALELRRRQQAERLRLRDTLERIETPQFGICPLCSQEIAFERLKAMPDAALCVACSP